MPTTAKSLGLGEIDLQSHLNEPLLARIPVRSLGDIEDASVRVAMASREQFERAGIARPFILSSVRFALVREGDAPYISVTTKTAVNEPFLNFLVAVDWASGRVLREYTLLLDPPVYAAAMKKRVEKVATSRESLPPGGNASEADRVSEQASGETTRSRTYGPVQSSDTSWILAGRFREDSSVTRHQMMLAMLRLNPDAFQRNNINLLKRGALLQIPSSEQAKELPHREALAEVRRQHLAWQDLRGNRRSSAPPPKRVSTAGVSPRAEEAVPDVQTQTPSSDRSTDPRIVGKLTLRSGDDAAVAVGVTSSGPTDLSLLQTELETVREEADASRRESEELAARVEEAEALVQELERLVKLRDADLAALLKQLKSPKADSAQTPAARPVTEPSSRQPTQAVQPQPEAATLPPQVQAKPPAKKFTPLPLPPVEKPGGVIELIQDSLVDVLPFDPVLIIGGVILIIVIAVVGIVFSRRRSVEGAEDDDTEGRGVGGIEPASKAGPDAPAAQILDAPPLAEVHPPDEEGVDSLEDREGWDEAVSTVVEMRLAEVNVYLAYERFDQAESLVRNAIENHPDRSEYRLKLLEIFHAAKDSDGFAMAASELEGLVGAEHPMMDTARDWWTDISPGTSLSAQGSFTSAPDASEEAVVLHAAVDDDIVPSADTSEKTIPKLTDGIEDGLTVAEENTESLQNVDRSIESEMSADIDLVGFGDTNEAVGRESHAAGDSRGSLDFDLEGFDDAGGENELLAGLEGTTTDNGVHSVEEVNFEEDTVLDVTLNDDRTGVDSMGEDRDDVDAQDSIVHREATLEPASSGIGVPAGELGEVEFDLASGGDETFPGGDTPAMTLSVDESFTDFPLETSGQGSDLASLGDGDDEPDVVAVPAVEEMNVDLEVMLGGSEIAEASDVSDGENEGEGEDEGEVGEFYLDVGIPSDSEGAELELELREFGEGIFDEAGSSSPSEFDVGDENDSEAGGSLITGQMDEEIGFTSDEDAGQGPGETQTKLDLAQAYIEMGDADGAKVMLAEVVSEGDDRQRSEAEALLNSIKD